MVHDGLWDIYHDYHMGMTAEAVAEKYGVARADQDEFAVNSHRKAIAAWKEGRFTSQVIPVEVPGKKKGRRSGSRRTSRRAKTPASNRCVP